jgi:hypothetical protein
MKQIGVKFCGGCNPQIDRSALLKELKAKLPAGYQLVTGSPAETWDKALLVCGCSAACADRPEVRKLSRDWVLVSGPMVDSREVPEKDLPRVLLERILES